MPVSPRTLRLTFAALAVLLLGTVAGFYFYARHRVRTAVRQIPKKLGVEIQQTAQGFTFSKSQGGRTLFTIRAAKTVQFKSGQRAQLNDVTIIVYGKRGNRFDQIYGSAFEYDPQAQTVHALGEVSIDLEGDTSTTPHPDQTPPQELKNPIHLKTSGLLFNQKTGIAETRELIEFRTPQAHGTARGARYDSNDGTLDIASDIHILAAENGGGNAQTRKLAGGEITARHGMITKDPLAATLDAVHGERAGETFAADRVRLIFHDDATLERANASGNVAAQRSGPAPANFRGGEVEMAFGPNNQLRTAVLTGHPSFDARGTKLVHGEAARAEVTFGEHNAVRHVRALQNVKLTQRPAVNVAVTQAKSPPKPKPGFHPNEPKAGSSGTPGLGGAPGSVVTTNAPQSLELNAQTLDVDLRAGKTIEKAWTTGGSVLTLPEGKLEAPRLDATFASGNRPQSLHATGGARLVSEQRTTGSRELQAGFDNQGRVSTLDQWGDFRYDEGTRHATAERARYTAADETFALTGNARYTDSSSQLSAVSSQPETGHAPSLPNAANANGTAAVSAATLRLNRRTGDVFAQGEVKATYTQMKPASGAAAGALFGGSSPVHATGAAMAASRQSGQARFTGGARLWQDANIVEAPTIEFDRTRRTMVARSAVASATGAPRVTTSFVQKDKQGKLTPVTITSAQLTYSDQDRQAHFTGGVVMRGADATVTADRADVLLALRGAAASSNANAPSQLQQVTAEGHVRLEEPRRRASGEKLVYTDADGKFVLTGGPPSIFDAEKGNLTGNSLTFFSRDDTVLVEGGTGQAITTQRTTR
jgi:lipopolysaccharide export system protein LptA